jgi:hypothetical protein
LARRLTPEESALRWAASSRKDEGLDAPLRRALLQGGDLEVDEAPRKASPVFVERAQGLDRVAGEQAALGSGEELELFAEPVVVAELEVPVRALLILRVQGDSRRDVAGGVLGRKTPGTGSRAACIDVRG